MTSPRFPSALTSLYNTSFTVALLRTEGKKRDQARALDGGRQHPLMLCAVAGYASRDDLPAFGNELLEPADVAIADGDGSIGAETAGLALGAPLLRGALDFGWHRCPLD
jgi:hypothetical protein